MWSQNWSDVHHDLVLFSLFYRLFRSFTLVVRVSVCKLAVDFFIIGGLFDEIILNEVLSIGPVEEVLVSTLLVWIEVIVLCLFVSRN